MTMDYAPEVVAPQVDLRNTDARGNTVVGPQQQFSAGWYAAHPGQDPYTAGSVTSPNSEGEIGVANSQAVRAAATAGARPWYMNYDLGTLEKTLTQHPEMSTLVPDDFLATFRNEFFVNNRPDLIPRLSKERLTGAGRWAGTGFAADIQTKYAPTAKPETVVPGPGSGYGGAKPPGLATTIPGPGPAAANTANAVTPGATGGGNWGNNPTSGLPAGVANAPVFWGAGQEPPGYRKPTWQELNQHNAALGKPPAIPDAVTNPALGVPRVTPFLGTNLPHYAPQTFNRMLPSEQVALGMAVNQTGGRSEDFNAYNAMLGEGPRYADKIYGTPVYSGAPKQGGW